MGCSVPPCIWDGCLSASMSRRRCPCTPGQPTCICRIVRARHPAIGMAARGTSKSSASHQIAKKPHHSTTNQGALRFSNLALDKQINITQTPAALPCTNMGPRVRKLIRAEPKHSSKKPHPGLSKGSSNKLWFELFSFTQSWNGHMYTTVSYVLQPGGNRPQQICT